MSPPVRGMVGGVVTAFNGSTPPPPEEDIEWIDDDGNYFTDDDGKFWVADKPAP